MYIHRGSDSKPCMWSTIYLTFLTSSFFILSSHSLCQELSFAVWHPLSRGCHPAISSPVVPFSSCPQSLPASGSFPMSQLIGNWSFSFSIIPSKEHPGLISFRMDGLDLLAVQGTLKSLLQHHSSEA